VHVADMLVEVGTRACTSPTSWRSPACDDRWLASVDTSGALAVEIVGMWTVNAEKLRAARRARGLTLEKLYDLSGVGRRTLQRWEARDTAGQPDLVQFVAAALKIEVSDLVVPSTDQTPRGKRPTAAEPPAVPVSVVPERERLHELARIEATEPAPRRRKDRVPWLTARDLHAMYSAFALRDGETFAFSGTLSREGAASAEEAKVVGAKPGTVACFVIERPVGQHQLAITVLTKSAASTRKLEAHVDGEALTLLVRVLVAEELRLVFTSMITRQKRAWTFVVETIEAG
jgi:transcriptional regulator with XRE-family HTH domain